MAQFMGVGIYMYARSIFFNAMFSDLGWSRGDLALAMSVGSILAAIVGPWVGDLTDKHGAGRLMAISAFLTGGCLIMLSWIHTLWQAFIIFTLVSVVQVGFMHIPPLVMASNWFVRKRGQAIGITISGAGFGGLVLSPLSTYLVSSLGWRPAWAVLGISLWVIIIPLSLLVVKQKPEDIGLLPDGVEPAGGVTPAAAGAGETPPKRDNWSLKSVLRMPLFWLIGIMFLLYLFGHQSIFLHGYSLFTDLGIPAITAGTMMGVLGLFSLGGKAILGYLTDRIPVRWVMLVAFVLATAAVLPLILGTSATGIWLFIVFWGFWECGIMALQPILVGSCFDRAIMGKMLGLFMIGSVPSLLFGSPFTGYVFDVTGSYNLALFVFMAFYLVCAVLVFFSHPTKR